MIEREGITHNGIGASTSRHPKPSWYKHPSRSLETNLNEYEWDALSKSSIVDMEIDVIHTYSTQLDVVDEPRVESNELDSHISLVDHVGPSMKNLDFDAFEAYSIGSTSLVTRDDIYHINNLGLATLLSLMHQDLI